MGGNGDIELSAMDTDSGKSYNYGAKSGSDQASASNDSTQQLDKYISLKPAVAFGLTLLSSWEGIGVTIGPVFLNGGPTTMIYGTILASLGTLALSASLGELASITPVVGAQYRWTGLYAPRIMSPAFWSLMQGWLTVFSWISLCAAFPFSSAIAMQGLIMLNSETYEPERWHVTLLMWAFLCIPFFCNIYARKLLATIEIMGGVLHIVFFVATVVTLITTAERSDAEFVFTESFFGASGWDSKGIQWCIGLLSITSVLTGFDGVLHLSDEITDAPKKVPLAMMWSVVLNSVMALGWLITILFCISDVEYIFNNPAILPTILIYHQATKSKAGATVLMVMILVVCNIALFGVFASVSRLTWAFARDKGLPFSSFFSYVHPTLRIPLRALGLVTVVSALIGLINIGSTTAFYAVLSLATMGLYLSYVMPILFVLLRKLEGNQPTYGPFNLGRWGIPINIMAVIFGIFIIIFLPFPTMEPVTADNMNYAAPILGAILLLALVDWFTGGKTRFQVPTS